MDFEEWKVDEKEVSEMYHQFVQLIKDSNHFVPRKMIRGEWGQKIMKNNDRIKRMNDKDLVNLIQSFQNCNKCPAAEYCLSTDTTCSDIILKWLNEDEVIYHIECKDKNTDEVVISFDVKKENLKVKESGKNIIFETQFGFNRVVNKAISLQF